MAELKTFSVLIAWSDDDEEQGEFGDTVRAVSFDKAERIVRARMIWSHWRDHWDRDFESRRESIASYRNPDGSYFGRVVESAPGAIWRAADLEKALRDMRTAYGRLHDFVSEAIEEGRLKEGDIPDDYQAIVSQLMACDVVDQKAKALIAEIDGF